ncbi:hypothetical protein ACFY19_25740 [Streptosporangium saharense]|uniref:hypothetical protein n=1 Tax=Streptosporangium saharense TaxID=1706840 RepID=UPI0036891184
MSTTMATEAELSAQIADLFDLAPTTTPVNVLPTMGDSGNCTNDGCTKSCVSCGCTGGCAS